MLHSIRPLYPSINWYHTISLGCKKAIAAISGTFSWLYAIWHHCRFLMILDQQWFDRHNMMMANVPTSVNLPDTLWSSMNDDQFDSTTRTHAYSCKPDLLATVSYMAHHCISLFPKYVLSFLQKQVLYGTSLHSTATNILALVLAYKDATVLYGTSLHSTATNILALHLAYKDATVLYGTSLHSTATYILALHLAYKILTVIFVHHCIALQTIHVLFILHIKMQHSYIECPSIALLPISLLILHIKMHFLLLFPSLFVYLQIN